MSSAHNKEPNDIFKLAVEAVISDDGFRVSSLSQKASRTAHIVLEWCEVPANLKALTSFTSDLFRMLESCVQLRRRLTHAHCIERVWGSFHQQRCSAEYKSLWSRFLLNSINSDDADPIFYQYITDFIMKVIIKQNFPVEEVDCRVQQPRLTFGYEERNVVRYVAGYILRALRKKIKRSSHTFKEELLLCLLDLLDDDDETSDETGDWVRLIDRGGLNRVSDDMFMLIACMELEVKRHIANSIALHDLNIKDLSAKILANGQVTFYWERLSVNWGEDESKSLLSLLIELWITIRGFAYTSTWMERYKAATCKKVQKSKGIRKTLVGSTSSEL